MITLIRNTWPTLLGITVGYAVMLAVAALLLMVSWNFFAASGIVPPLDYLQSGGLVGLLVMLRILVVRPTAKSRGITVPKVPETRQPIAVEDSDVQTFELPEEFMEAVQNAMREKEFIDNLAKAPLKRPEKLD